MSEWNISYRNLLVMCPFVTIICLNCFPAQFSPVSMNISVEHLSKNAVLYFLLLLTVITVNISVVLLMSPASPPPYSRSLH